MTDKPARCGAQHPKQKREVCTRDAGHVGMHSNGGNVTWKKVASDTVQAKPVDDRPMAAPCRCNRKNRKGTPHDLGEPVTCKVPNHEMCMCSSGKERKHLIGSPGCEAARPCGDTMGGVACTQPKGHAGDHVGKGGTWTRDRKTAHFDCKPDEVEDDDDPFEDEIRSDEDRAFARQQREAREAHARELEDETLMATGGNGAQRDPATPLEMPGMKQAAGRHLSDVKVHPAADVFPMLEGEEYEALREDIRRNGVRVRPVLDADGLLVDGRNRLRACEELGISVVFDRLPAGTDVVDFVISTNLRRRHLNASQRSMFADAVANLKQGRPTQTGSTAGLTQKQAAQRFGVSERSVREARVVRESAAPEVVGAVEQGKLSVDAAAKLAKLPHAKQKAIYEREIKPKKEMVRGGKIKALTKQEEKRAVVRKINEQRVAPMPVGAFGVIYGDYPWLYDNSDQHEGSRGHMGYPGMPMDEIIAHARETAKRAARDCVIALWVTNAFITKIGVVLDALGAEQRSVFTWPKPRFVHGTWGRGQTEHLVIASIGSPVHTLNEVSTLLPSWRPARPGEHSSKPAEVAALLAKHCGGPFLELFARDQRPNWTCWGADVDKFATEAA